MATDKFWNHSIEKLEEALNLKRQIAQLEAKLSFLFGGSSKPAAKKAGAASTSGRKRTMSPAARARIAAAQRARWAKVKGGATTSKKVAGPTAAKKKGGLTPAGRRKLSQMMKARWAAKKKGR